MLPQITLWVIHWGLISTGKGALTRVRVTTIVINVSHLSLPMPTVNYTDATEVFWTRLTITSSDLIPLSRERESGLF